MEVNNVPTSSNNNFVFDPPSTSSLTANSTFMNLFSTSVQIQTHPKNLEFKKLEEDFK